MKLIIIFLFFSLISFNYSKQIEFALINDKISTYSCENLFKNIYYIQLDIDKQKLNLFLNFYYDKIIIFGSNITFSKFNESKSTHYKKISETYDKIISKYKINYIGINSTDIFNDFGVNINFFLINEIEEAENSDLNYQIFKDGFIGLNYIYYLMYKPNSILYQLNNQKKISNFFYSFDFKKNKLILGEKIDEKNPEYFKKNAEQYPNRDLWELYFNSIYFIDNDNNKISDDILKSIFSPSYNGIIGSESYRNYFVTNFSNFYSCHEEKFKYLNINLIGYFCDKNTKIDKLKSIHFKCNDLNYTFELDYNDLFEKHDDKYFFNVYFFDDSQKSSNQISNSYWYLGYTFFKKYKIIFNQDLKTIGFLHENPLNKKNNSFSWFYKFLCFVLFIIIVFLSYFLYKFYIEKPRRIKANELNENFDYQPNLDVNNEDYTKIDDNNNIKSKLIA